MNYPYILFLEYNFPMENKSAYCVHPNHKGDIPIVAQSRHQPLFVT